MIVYAVQAHYFIHQAYNYNSSVNKLLEDQNQDQSFFCFLFLN